MGKENLIQYNGQTPAIARENGRKGGVASGASKRRRKALREVFNELLPMEVKDAAISSRCPVSNHLVLDLPFSSIVTDRYPSRSEP